MTFAPALTAMLSGRLAEGRGRPPDDQRLARGDLQVAEQARPGRGVGLRDRGQVGPREARLDGRHVRHGGAGVLGVAAVDRPAQPAHQGRHLGPDGELAAGAGLDDADALDAADVGDLGPLALPHVQLGVVEAERLDLDHRVAVFRLRLRDLPDDQHLRPAEPRPENRSHGISSRGPVRARTEVATTEVEDVEPFDVDRA